MFQYVGFREERLHTQTGIDRRIVPVKCPELDHQQIGVFVFSSLVHTKGRQNIYTTMSIGGLTLGCPVNTDDPSNVKEMKVDMNFDLLVFAFLYRAIFELFNSIFCFTVVDEKPRFVPSHLPPPDQPGSVS